MGREIRRVTPDWQHPTNRQQYDKYGGDYRRAHSYPDETHPLYDEFYGNACEEWRHGFLKWEAGEYPGMPEPVEGKPPTFYWEYVGDPPDPAYYRHVNWTEAEATAYQIYETVSEGTPTSPVFETLDAMESWLVQTGKSSAEGARNFITTGWMQSGLMFGGTLAFGMAVADHLPTPTNPDQSSRELGKQIIKAIDDVLKPLAAKPDATVGEGDGA